MKDLSPCGDIEWTVVGTQGSDRVTNDAMISLRSAGEVGSALRAIRLRRGITQAEVAEAAGISRKWVSNAERGKPSADVGLVVAVLRALDYRMHFHNRPDRPTDRPWAGVAHSRYQVGCRVREIRRRQSLTQVEVAQSAGVSRSWLCGLERDDQKHSAELSLVLRVLEVLGYEMEFFTRPESGFDLDAHLESFRRGGVGL